MFKLFDKIFFGKQQILTKELSINYDEFKKKLVHSGFQLADLEENIKVIDSKRIRIALDKGQFTPYFDGGFKDLKEKCIIEGSFKLPRITILFVIIWFSSFFIGSLMWAFGSPLKDGIYLPLFILLGIIIMLNYRFKGIKEIRNFVTKINQY